MTVPLLSRIVVATDLGPDTQSLLTHGLRLALDSGARLCVLHAHRGAGPPHPWDVRPILRDLLRSWGEVPEQAKEPGEVVAGLDLVQLSVAGPDPVAALAEAAENLGPDLLLVGGERRHGLDRLVHSSAAERIARTFSVGTLFLSRGAQGLVHPGTGRLELRRVMVPVGDEIQAQDALSAALAFLSAVRAFDTVIDLLHVSPSPVDMPAVIVPDGVKVEWRWTSSPVVPGILAEIHATHPNLVVMVTRGHDSLADALAGSRTERVMREAPCPVLAVPLEL